MWKTARRTLLLGALLLASARAQNAAVSDVLVTMEVSVDGSFRNLQLLRGESVEDAATTFARSNGLVQNRDDAAVQEVIDRLSGMLKDRVAELQAPLTVQLAFPLVVDSYKGELVKYESETIDEAVTRFLLGTGFGTDAMRDLYPKITSIVEDKLAQLQPPRKELFSLEITVDGVTTVARHFEGGSPMEEALITLRSININEGEQMDRLAPLVANEITKKWAEMSETTQSQPAAPETGMPSESSAQRQTPEELFSIPMTINDQPAVLVQFDGMTARETALRFLKDNGVVDPVDISSNLPQLIDMIDSRMAEYLRDEAAARAAAAPPAQPSLPSRHLLLRVPVNLGDNRSVNLEYYEGDSIERTVELFLESVGLAESPTFNDLVTQLTGVIHQRLTADQQWEQEQEQLRQQRLELERQQQQQEQQQEQQQQQELERPREQQAQAETQETPRKLLVSLPVKLSGMVYTLDYYEGEELAFVANTFCVEKHELVRAELGLDFTGNELQECKNLLVDTINKQLTQHAQRLQQAQTDAQDQAQTVAGTRGDLLFTLDIDDGEGKSYQMPFHRNDDVRAVAIDFCKQHDLDLSNVPALVQGIQSQLAQL